MTYFCPDCCVNWFPFQCDKGCCPECGGGTKRTSEPVSPDASSRFAHAKFEAFYAEREAERRAGSSA